ncbi:hypothetical protein GCM10018780_00390 [Streptomyces lanatus]|nr:hypothetical protein GCM10018780_00390 [Streptomyces lanatus]
MPVRHRGGHRRRARRVPGTREGGVPGAVQPFASVFWAALVLPYFAIGTFWTQVFGAEFVLLIGSGVLALGGLVSQFLAPETTDMDLARAARKARGA